MPIRDGRFGGDVNEAFSKINSSIDFDKKLYREDIRGSVAYAKALCMKGILSESERDDIIEARNSKEEQFGMERIVKELTKNTSESFERVFPSLIYAVQQWQNSFSSQDDISFLSVEIQ